MPLVFSFCRWGSAAPITALAYSPDGAALVAATGDEVLLRSPTTGQAIEAIACRGMRVVALAFSPDGNLLAVGGGTPGEAGEIRLLSWSDRRWLGSVEGYPDTVTDLAMHPDGHRLASACADGTARVYAMGERGQNLFEKLVLSGHLGPVQAVAFSPEGNLVLTTSLDRSIKVWSVTSGKLLRSLDHHTDAVHCVTFHPSLKEQPQCATAGDDRTVRVWQPAIGRMMRIVRDHGGPILALAFAPDGRSLFSAGAEGIVRQIDANSDAVLNQWQASSDWIHHIAISPEGDQIATGDWAGNVTVRAIR